MTGNYLVTNENNGPASTGEEVGTFGEVINANAGINTSGSAPVITPTFDGTASQLSDTSRDYMVYLTVTTSGTVTTVEFGPTSAAVDDVILVDDASVTAGQCISFRLPAGWWVKASGTTTVFLQTAVGC